VCEAQYYSSFDFSAWFQQFEFAPEDRDKVAFVIPGDNISPPQTYQWKRMCFGLLNAGYWSQRQLQEALERFDGCTGIYPFMDDIVIASDTLQEHLEKIEAFMRFCKHHNIRIKREKVELVTGAVKHLGCILSDEGQALDPARIESLLAIGAPSNLKGLKSLLGSFSFIRGWLAGMADTAAPLTDLGAQARRMGFQWGPEQEAALDALKLSCEIAPARDHLKDITVPSAKRKSFRCLIVNMTAALQPALLCLPVISAQWRKFPVLSKFLSVLQCV
jgi:hypothetical protein